MEMHFFSKKVSKKFGQFEKSVYLCTRKSDNEELNGSVAQLNRASDYGSEGCGFESRRNHEKAKNDCQRQSFLI